MKDKHILFGNCPLSKIFQAYLFPFFLLDDNEIIAIQKINLE